jgi:hypothetical protein
MNIPVLDDDGSSAPRVEWLVRSWRAHAGNSSKLVAALHF